MVADFIESKMKKILETTEDPLEYEVQEILIEKYLKLVKRFIVSEDFP